MSLFTRRLPHRHEAVEIQEKRLGYFPKVFRWHGKRYVVEAVERCWSRVFADTDGQPFNDILSRRKCARSATMHASHLCFRVRCREGIFDLYQNVRDNTWRLVPVRA